MAVEKLSDGNLDTLTPRFLSLKSCARAGAERVEKKPVYTKMNNTSSRRRDVFFFINFTLFCDVSSFILRFSFDSLLQSSEQWHNINHRHESYL